MPASLPRPISSGQAQLRILVADDNKMLRTAVRGLLRILGHSVEAVANGREAVASALRGNFDLVLLDIQMPEMGGLEAARLLRQQDTGQRRPRIIGMSA